MQSECFDSWAFASHQLVTLSHVNEEISDGPEEKQFV